MTKDVKQSNVATCLNRCRIALRSSDGCQHWTTISTLQKQPPLLDGPSIESPTPNRSSHAFRTSSIDALPSVSCLRGFSNLVWDPATTIWAQMASARPRGNNFCCSFVIIPRHPPLRTKLRASLATHVCVFRGHGWIEQISRRCAKWP